MSLQSLIYVSSAKKPCPMMPSDTYSTNQEQITCNPISTSMLLYRDGFFMQAIEGEGDKVDYLFDKIAMDDRHEDIVVVYKNQSNIVPWRLKTCQWRWILLTKKAMIKSMVSRNWTRMPNRYFCISDEPGRGDAGGL